MKFQEEGIRFGLARQGRVLIADEMGVGKTLQAIALASCYQVQKTCPNFRAILLPADIHFIRFDALFLSYSAAYAM